ncbi:MAG: spore cortex biosynthesis protein YabQ [Firmicutes bacterium]|nr:spore cortex biosynthesis protein YabQ [Bacillota bacterium]
MESLSAQLYAFGIILLAGLSVGFLVDFYRVLRGILRPGLVSTAILDLMFWALLTPVLVSYLLLANWGQLRGYVVIAIILGFAFYRLTMSRAVVALLVWLIDLVGKLLTFIASLAWSIVTLPLVVGQELGLGIRSIRLRRRFIFSPGLRWRK